MKILTRKKQHEILRRVAANLIIDSDADMDAEAFRCAVKNACEIATLIGGTDGTINVLDTVINYAEDKLSKIREAKSQMTVHKPPGISEQLEKEEEK